MNNNVYEITIVGIGDNQYRADVTEIESGITLSYVSRWRWWLKTVTTNPFRLSRDFKRARKTQARAEYKKTFYK